MHINSYNIILNNYLPISAILLLLEKDSGYYVMPIIFNFGLSYFIRVTIQQVWHYISDISSILLIINPDTIEGGSVLSVKISSNRVVWETA